MFVLLITAFIIPVAVPYSFPENFERCHIQDANLDNCLKTTIQNAFRLIGTTGISSINLPSIEPIEAATLVIGTGTRVVNLVQKYEHVEIYGFMNATVKDAHLDLEKKVLTFTTYASKMFQRAKYNINGKILLLTLYGAGDSTITLFEPTITHIINFKEEIRRNKTYFKIMSYTIRISIVNVHFDFQNLFNGDQQLADNVLQVVNDNGLELFSDVKEEMQVAYAEICKNLATRLFNNIPVDEIFLP